MGEVLWCPLCLATTLSRIGLKFSIYRVESGLRFFSSLLVEPSIPCLLANMPPRYTRSKLAVASIKKEPEAKPAVAKRLRKRSPSPERPPSPESETIEAAPVKNAKGAGGNTKARCAIHSLILLICSCGWFPVVVAVVSHLLSQPRWLRATVKSSMFFGFSAVFTITNFASC